MQQMNGTAIRTELEWSANVFVVDSGLSGFIVCIFVGSVIVVCIFVFRITVLIF